MRALQLTEWKQQPQIREVAEPEPGPGQVVVRIAGAGACHSDLHLMHDFDAGSVPWSPPFTLGHENAGWVHALGAGVTGFEVGEPVAVYGPWGCGHCVRCRAGAENYCDNAGGIPYAGGGLGTDGGMAEYLLVPSARHLVKLGEVDPVEAAPLTDAALTPYHAIKRSLPLLVPGSTTVVIGAGGLGHMAIQLLGALCPTKIVVVDQRDEALFLAAELGADHTVKAGPDAVREITEISGGRGTDFVLDLVGADSTIALGAAVARSNSHVTVVGIAGGTYTFSFFSQRYAVALSTTYWGTVTELAEVIALAEAGRVRPHIELFPLDQANEAYERMRNGTLNGRAVIVPGTGSSRS
ncbi:MAG TPA: NAD(P)-dependent alcohol dehydrogenase [Acidimicrobiales bacterium]